MTPMSQSDWTVPTAEEYAAAFEFISDTLSESDRRMLALHYFSPQRTVSASEMAEAMGYANFGGANLLYGKIGGRLCRYFGIEPKYKVSALVEFIPPNTQGNAYWLWVMRPQVAQALAAMDLIAARNR